MPSHALEYRLGKIGEVHKIDQVTYNLEIDSKKMQILVNPVHNKIKYILIENQNRRYFRLANELIQFLKPKENKDDMLKVFVNSELHNLVHIKGQKHIIYCYNMEQVETLTEKINKGCKWKTDWYYSLIEKCYVIECRRGKNV